VLDTRKGVGTGSSRASAREGLPAVSKLARGGRVWKPECRQARINRKVKRKVTGRINGALLSRKEEKDAVTRDQVGWVQEKARIITGTEGEATLCSGIQEVTRTHRTFRVSQQ